MGTFLDINHNLMSCLLHCHCKNSTLPWKPSYLNCRTSCCTSISNKEFTDITKENQHLKSVAQNVTKELSNVTKLYESLLDVQPTSVTSIISDCTIENVFLGVFVAITLLLLCWVLYKKRKSDRLIKKLCNTNVDLKSENTSLNATVTTQNHKIQEMEDQLVAAQHVHGSGIQQMQMAEDYPPANVPVIYANTGS